MIGINSARSAFANFTFPKHFFDNYTITANNQNTNTGSNPQLPPLQFKVLAKPLVSIFKFRGGGGSTSNHKIERCILKIENTSTDQRSLFSGLIIPAAEVVDTNINAGECRLVVEITQQAGVRKTHRLFYWDCEVLHAPYNRENSSNMWMASAKVIGDWIAHFQRGLEEVSMIMSNRVVKICSWTDYNSPGMGTDDQYQGRGGGVKAGESSRAIHTEISIDPEEFEIFELGGGDGATISTHDDGVGVELGFSLREFKAILLYADAISASVEAHFDQGGSPVIFSVQTMDESNVSSDKTTSMSVTAQLILATISNAETQISRPSGMHQSGMPQPSPYTPQPQINPYSGANSAISQNTSGLGGVPRSATAYTNTTMGNVVEPQSQHNISQQITSTPTPQSISRNLQMLSTGMSGILSPIDPWINRGISDQRSDSLLHSSPATNAPQSSISRPRPC